MSRTVHCWSWAGPVFRTCHHLSTAVRGAWQQCWQQAVLCREVRGWPHMEQARAVWKCALLDAGTSAHVNDPRFAPRPGRVASGRDPPPPRGLRGTDGRP